MYDYHLHSIFSIDSKATMEDMVISAINKNLKSICFTDHVDMETTENNLDIHFIPKDYFKGVNKVKYKYIKEIEVLCGVEIGMQPQLIDRYKDFISNNPFDFVIMSIHSLQGKDIFFDNFLEGKQPLNALEIYYENMYKCVKEFDDFDTLGHIDFIDRYFEDFSLIPRYEEYSDIIDNILKTIIEKGKGLEVNTAGLRYGLEYLHPKIQILRRYKELGGEILTIGSDAHSPEDVGYEYKLAEKLLRDLGFKYIYIFKERKKFPIKI